MAKDVVTFLNWAAEPEHDERKKIGLKAVILFSALTAISLYVKRFKWTVIKNRKICRWYFTTHSAINDDLFSL
jgi:ubiquinol-cytochrome c reductase cytochrome c1 subunit